MAGALAARLGVPASKPVQVRLLLPPPLERPLSVQYADGVLALADPRTDQPVAEARLSPTTLTPPPGVPLNVALDAAAGYPGHRHHPFPTCFSCGPGRDDGLRIFPGPASGSSPTPLVAAPWVPEEADVATTWAALDCVGGWAGDLEERPMVLGSITAHVLATPELGQAHVVVGQSRGSEGRKTFTASALYSGDGRLVGAAEHVWIAVDPAVFNTLQQ